MNMSSKCKCKYASVCNVGLNCILHSDQSIDHACIYKRAKCAHTTVYFITKPSRKHTRTVSQLVYYKPPHPNQKTR